MNAGRLRLTMAVVSVSLPEDLLEEMDGAIAAGHYKGRSEFLRAAARDRLGSHHAPSTGRHLHGSITILYPHGTEARISEVRHAFHDVVLSLMHTHCEEEACMDVLIVAGPPARIQALHGTLERMREVQRCRLALMA